MAGCGNKPLRALFSGPAARTHERVGGLLRRGELPLMASAHPSVAAELTMRRSLMHCLARRLPLIMVVLLLPGAALADRLIDGVPLPDDISVAPVSAATADSGHSFLGAWVGRWGGSLKHIL